MTHPLVLIAEGREEVRREWKRALLARSLRVRETSGIHEIRRLADRDVSLVILGLLDGDPEAGLREAGRIRESDPSIPIILTMEAGSERTAVAALRAGVNDYFAAPCAVDELCDSVQRHARRGRDDGVDTCGGDVNMLGESAAMRRIRRFADNLARSDSNVLITGETGTGKELVARLVHRNSQRRHKPFVCINCAALPESLFESELFGYARGAFTGAAQPGYDGKLKLADGGTVFFDEIGDMSPLSQAKILRAIEQKQVHSLGGREAVPVDIRVVAATNQDLETMCEKGTFRKDLYFRLNVARIHLPPLRERKEDIDCLVKHYLAEMNRRFSRQVEGFTSDALAFLLRYPWPGNVRELRNLMEAIFVNLPPRRVSVADLPEQFRRHLQDPDLLPQSERERLLVTLLETNWNKSIAARKLQWSRMTLYRKMMKYKISSSSREPSSEDGSSGSPCDA